MSVVIYREDITSLLAECAFTRAAATQTILRSRELVADARRLREDIRGTSEQRWRPVDFPVPAA